ncbi:DUF805 domain-containing protein [Micromonospora sp. STR1s_5]|nr:DUF805 domain-containing protein [Micromonospora sp. STR1s_5]
MTIQQGHSARRNSANRASRSQFWRTMAAVWAFGIATVIADYILFGGESSELRGVFLAVAALSTLLPGITISVRRLHDIDRSGWYVLLGFAPVVGIVLMVVLGCIPGTPGPNRFGRNPLGDKVRPWPTRTSPVERDVVTEIERLANLKANGSLSESEYAALKARALQQSWTA